MSTSEFVTQTSVPAIWLFAAIIGAGIHSARSTTLTRLEIWQRWWATVALGCGSAWMALSFLLAPTVMTTAIGFAQTPFVTEIAFANLGLAVGGPGTARRPARTHHHRLRGRHVLVGAVIGHLYQSVAQGNWSPGSTGGVLVYDAVIPAVMIILAVLSRRTGGVHTVAAEETVQSTPTHIDSEPTEYVTTEADSFSTPHRSGPSSPPLPSPFSTK